MTDHSPTPTAEDSAFVLTGFADEIAPDLETQLDVLEDLGIDHLDLRNVDETNVLDFDAEIGRASCRERV